MKQLRSIIMLAVVLLTVDSISARSIHLTYKVDTSGTCYSALLDTAVNPYNMGISGNWRPKATYVFYGSRTESNAAQETNIRQAGTLASFDAFWKLNPGTGWQAAFDTSKWVWNQQSTLINTKGFELENKDPLGRYNAGIYGYDNELPVAVVQNARYREVVFEGFEDYGYGLTPANIACETGRNLDFQKYKSWIDSSAAHTGRYSLLIPKDMHTSEGAIITDTDIIDFDFAVNKRNMACSPGEGLQSIRANTKVVLPSFSPFPGKKMLVSAWVKEQTDCNCNAYTNAQIVLLSGSTSVTCKPKGIIIDGWQRIEEVIDVPATATSFSVALYAGAGTGVYFDDIRIHPFNANMQSYIYDPVTLRLMAQLDENNFASFYEYDDEGTLVRLKKETERGIKTIKETRSALIKDENL
ncbi:hypothetical protein ACE38W_10095 [Chitinophaga sp. Hz27]|uniref:hypothetical protein n=1 Tax=Chitinophaga sp. Hz27 TaxID=3347169 RepID=UPI0035D6166D